MRMLITGANGFIGKKCCEYFSQKGNYVRAMVRNIYLTGIHKSKNIQLVQGDMKDIGSLIEATKNIDFVIHLAAKKSDEPDSYGVNVLGAENLVKACRRNKVKFIVNISTMSTKIKNKGIYGSTKNMADEIFKKSGLNFVTIKPSVVYGDKKSGIFGTLTKFSSWFIVPIIGNGQTIFMPIFIGDLTKVIEIAIKNRKYINGKIYDALGPDKITFEDLIKKIASKSNTNKKPIIVHIPIFVGIILAKVFNVIMKTPPITKSNILGSNQEVLFDTKEFFSTFKFKHTILERGLSIIFDRKND